MSHSEILRDIDDGGFYSHPFYMGYGKYIPIQFDSKIAILYYFRIIFRLVAVNWSKIRGSSKF